MFTCSCTSIAINPSHCVLLTSQTCNSSAFCDILHELKCNDSSMTDTSDITCSASGWCKSHFSIRSLKVWISWHPPSCVTLEITLTLICIQISIHASVNHNQISSHHFFCDTQVNLLLVQRCCKWMGAFTYSMICFWCIYQSISQDGPLKNGETYGLNVQRPKEGNLTEKRKAIHLCVKYWLILCKCYKRNDC